MQTRASFSQIKYLLWDNDGVLVDTEQYYFAAGCQVLSEIGIRLTQAQFRETSLRMGQSVFDLASAHGISNEQLRLLRKKRDSLYSDFLRTEDILIPGVEEVVTQCAAHFKMCIVSSSMKNNFFEIHSRTGNLLSFFAFQLLNGDYPNSKPHPDPWLAAMKRFEATPEQCLVIEDSPRGIQAARAAGMTVVAIESAFFKAPDLHPYLSPADHCISNITELPNLLGLLDA
ncbi:MAG: HAD family phosphatase [Deltaproteobacteria bacterium]|nr:HAD family phosphatase [Deltaproteobacteria bacterium]